MKRFWLLVLLVAVAAPSGASSLGIGVAYLDTESAADDNGAGLRLGLDAGEHWNIEVRASFFDGHAFVLGERTYSVEATAIDLGLSYDLNPGSRATAYVGAGLSYSLFDSDVFNVRRGVHEPSSVEDEPGWYAVVGIEGPVTGSLGYFLEALYRQNKPTVEGDGIAELGSVAVDFAGLGATLGVALRW